MNEGREICAKVKEVKSVGTVLPVKEARKRGRKVKDRVKERRVKEGKDDIAKH